MTEPLTLKAIRLFLDDVREPPNETWTLCRNYAEAMHWIANHEIVQASLDHDIGDDGKTGYEVLLALLEKGVSPNRIAVHSWNPAGRARMHAALRSARESGGGPSA